MFDIGKLFLDGLIVCSDLCISGTFASVLLKLMRDRNAVGLSLQTLVAVVTARTMHTTSHLFGLHYRPSVVPTALYVMFDLINAAIGIAAIVAFMTQFMTTYEREKDNFGIHLFQRFNLLPKKGPFSEGPLPASMFMYSVVTVLAFGWYYVRGSRMSFLSSYFCCFYEVLLAVALFPQLWMFHQDKRVSPLLANFVVLTAMTRGFTLAFWFFYPSVHLWHYPDNRGVQMASEVLNIAILSDFLFYWIRSKVRGEREIVIGDGNLV
eukprot:TRINITY_DN6693_c0_g1_i1.p1 TRINITY_DN6693_c0_g1~~TRINITY_DN6693_c0_g1_i1.p1  ORF type:complete len:265 (+),score=27.49 TRINITY_DN6693_c0_g1_i1:142-936(+)